MNILLRALYFFLALASVNAGEAASPGVFHPQTFTLANGLQVVVISNHRAPVVEQAVWYKAGAIDEPEGTSGIAHFLEHLMFKGTPNIPEGQFAKLITHCGGSYNAATTADYTYYHEKVAVAHLELIIKLEADRMQNLLLRPKDIETERKVILEERRLRIDNFPLALLSEALNAAFYWHHPYRRPVIGWEHEMETLSHQDALAFYDAWYHPNNAVVIFAGDVTLEQIKPLVEKHYGAIPAKPLPKRKTLREPKHHGIKQRLELMHHRIEHPFFYRVYPAAGYADHQKDKIYALQLLAYILTGNNNGRFTHALVDHQKIADNISISYSSYDRGPTVFEVSAQPARGKGLRELEQAFAEEAHKLIREGVSEKEVKDAQRRIVANVGYAKDSAFGGLENIGVVLCTGGSLEDVENWPARIQSVTREQVNAAAHDVFNSSYFATAIAKPLENKPANQ